MPLAADVDEALRVAHHERPELEAELLAVAERQVVDARDAHRAGLGVQARRELAERVDAAADAVLGLQDQRVVARPRELVAGDEAGHAGADDDHPLAGLVAALEPVHDPAVPLPSFGRKVPGSGRRDRPARSGRCP